MKKLFIILVLIMVAAVAASAQQRFVASLDGKQEVPANGSGGKGTCTIVLNAAQTSIAVNCTFSGLGAAASAGHIHGNGVVGVNAPVLFPFTGVPAATSGSIGPLNFAVTPAQVADLRAHRMYANIHTASLPGGEIRGQVKQVHTVFDRDGDGRTDVTIFRQSTNQMWIQNSLDGQVPIILIGSGSGDNWLNNTSDFDGDGRGDMLLIKIFGNNANWAIYNSDTNTFQNVLWGDFSAAIGDTLAMADYDGDGKTDVAVFRRSNGDWWIKQSSDGATRVAHWGALNDFPSIGDYDGDGKADLTVVRVETGQRVWYTLRSSDGQSTRTPWGSSATDGLFFFAPFDYDGDGKQDISVNRTVGTQRNYFILRSSDGQGVQIPWGAAGTGSTALFGDYDGDGKTDIVARSVIGGVMTWQILRSSDGGTQFAYFGITGDQ